MTVLTCVLIVILLPPLGAGWTPTLPLRARPASTIEDEGFGRTFDDWVAGVERNVACGSRGLEFAVELPDMMLLKLDVALSPWVDRAGSNNSPPRSAGRCASWPFRDT